MLGWEGCAGAPNGAAGAPKAGWAGAAAGSGLPNMDVLEGGKAEVVVAVGAEKVAKGSTVAAAGTGAGWLKREGD